MVDNKRENSSGEPRIIEYDLETSRRIRAYEPLSKGALSRKGLTMTGIIHDDDEVVIHPNMLPVTMEFSDGDILVDIFHDFDMTTESSWYDSFGPLGIAFLEGLQEYRSWLDEIKPDTNIGSGLTLPTFLGNQFDIGTAYRKILNIISTHLSRKWNGVVTQEDKAYRMITFLPESEEAQVGAAFQFADEYYAYHVTQPLYDDDVQRTAIRQAKMKWAGLCRLYGVREGQGLLWLYFDELLGDATLDAASDESLTTKLTEIIDRVHFNPYNVDSYVDPISYAYATLFLIAGYNYLKKKGLEISQMMETIAFRVVSPADMTAARDWIATYVSQSFPRMGWAHSGGTRKLRALPVGRGNTLSFTKFDPDAFGYLPTSKDLAFEGAPMLTFNSHESYNFSRDGLLPTTPAIWNRIYGLTLPMDRMPKILSLDVIIPWSLVRQPDSQRYSDITFWPILYLRLDGTQLQSLMTLPANAKFGLPYWIEGFDSVFAGNAFKFNWVHAPMDKDIGFTLREGRGDAIVTKTVHIKAITFDAMDEDSILAKVVNLADSIENGR